MSLAAVALVTGAGRRLGRAIALDLAAQGYAVAVHYGSSAADAAAVVAHIRADGGIAEPFQANLADEAAVAGLVPKVEARFGPVTCLVNNASAFERDAVLTATRASWDAHLDTNLRAPFVLTQAMAKALDRATGGRREPDTSAIGAVINMLDQRVWNLTPHFTSYTVSKFALWGLTRTLALALAPAIRVNAIGPGPALPDKRQTQAQFDRQCAEMPLMRGTTPDEICAAIRFILAAPAMTGQMIALDGGQHLGWAQPARAAGGVA